MNKQIRLIPALAFGMAILSISTLANAEVIVNVQQATLVAKGAGVDVSVQITCNPAIGDNSLVFISGMLIQRTGNSTTDANVGGMGGMGVSDTLNCNGSPQDLDVIATVTSPRKPFKQGPALISISASVFNTLSGQFDSGVFPLQEIQIRH
jgi:hypothetical protein